MTRWTVFGTVGAFLAGACLGLSLCVLGGWDRGRVPPAVPAGGMVFVIRVAPELSFRGSMEGPNDYTHEYGFPDPDLARAAADEVKAVMQRRFGEVK